MRIAVGRACRRPASAPASRQRLDHGGVGVALLAVGVSTRLPANSGDMGDIGAVAADGLRHLDAVAHAELVVVRAVAGRDMDEAGAVLGGDEIAGQQRHVELIAAGRRKRMRGDGAGERGALDRTRASASR